MTFSRSLGSSELPFPFCKAKWGQLSHKATGNTHELPGVWEHGAVIIHHYGLTSPRLSCLIFPSVRQEDALKPPHRKHGTVLCSSGSALQDGVKRSRPGKQVLGDIS